LLVLMRPGRRYDHFRQIDRAPGSLRFRLLEGLAVAGADARPRHMRPAGLDDDPVCKHRAAFYLLIGALGPQPPAAIAQAAWAWASSAIHPEWAAHAGVWPASTLGASGARTGASRITRSKRRGPGAALIETRAWIGG
jgi:hypothetical protein